MDMYEIIARTIDDKIETGECVVKDIRELEDRIRDLESQITAKRCLLGEVFVEALAIAAFQKAHFNVRNHKVSLIKMYRLTTSPSPGLKYAKEYVEEFLNVQNVPF